MRLTIADIVHVAILLIAGAIVLNTDVDFKGYTIGMLVGSMAAGFAAGIKGKA